MALDDEGSLLLTESEEDRVVPSRSAVLAAGRYDLHQAVQLHGGYGAVSALLARRAAWPPAQHLRTLRALASELRRFVAAAGLPRRTMPPASLLLDTGRNDLYQVLLRYCGCGTVVAACWLVSPSRLLFSCRRLARLPAGSRLQACNL